MTITLQALKARRPRTNPDCPAPYHGTEAAAGHAGCRCQEAREERRIRNKRRRENRLVSTRIDVTGTRRRLQALAVLGWRWADIAERMGGSYQVPQALATTDQRTVHVHTARRVAATYRLLVDRTGPSHITRRRALAKGWVGPLAWRNIDNPAETPDQAGPVEEDRGDSVDEVAVARTVHDTDLFHRLNPAERRAVWRAWVRRRRQFGEDGQGLLEFGRTYGLTKRQATTLRDAAERELHSETERPMTETEAA